MGAQGVEKVTVNRCLKQHEAEHVRQGMTETVSEPKSQEKLTTEKNGKLSQEKEKVKRG